MTFISLPFFTTHATVGWVVLVMLVFAVKSVVLFRSVCTLSALLLQSSPCRRSAPPTYEEALNSRLADQHRIPTSSRARPHPHHGHHLAASPAAAASVRSLSEERTLPTAGAAAAVAGAAGATSSGGLRGRRAYMVRSSRAEEIPDIYWEQAARELDFCTCRKCQVRIGIVSSVRATTWPAAFSRSASLQAGPLPPVLRGGPRGEHGVGRRDGHPDGDAVPHAGGAHRRNGLLLTHVSRRARLPRTFIHHRRPPGGQGHCAKGTDCN